MEKNNKPSSEPNQLPYFSCSQTTETTEERPFRKSVLGKAYLHRIARDARRNGFIALDELYLILAEAEVYSDILYWLWRDFQCNWRPPISPELLDQSFSLKRATHYLQLSRRKIQELIGSGEVPFFYTGEEIFFSGKDLETYVKKSYEVYVDNEEGRIILWRDLVYRWAGLGITRNKKPILLLPLFKTDGLTGKLREVKYPGQEEGVDYVKLQDLKEYLESIQKEYEIRLPLPKRLFDEDVHEEKIEIPADDRDATSSQMQIKEAENAKEAERANLFRKKGDVWEIAFEGSDIFFVNDAIGLKYIHLLLGRPGDPISAVEMAQMGRWEQNHDSAEYDGMTSDQLKTGGLRKANLDSSLKEKTDEKTRARDEKDRVLFQSRLEEIEEHISETNTPEINFQLKEERELFLEKLNQRKQSAKIKDEYKNPRSAVTMAIARAIKQINEHLPALAEYLDQTIKTGEACLYHPLAEKLIDWNF
jgi:hypothetical protein